MSKAPNLAKALRKKDVSEGEKSKCRDLRWGKIDMSGITRGAGISDSNGNIVALRALDQDLFAAQLAFFVHITVKFFALQKER